MEIINIVILAVSGLLLLSVGTLRSINPINAYAKNSGIKLANEVNLLNEIRGISSVMLFSGVVILLGIIIPQLTLTSFVVAALIFLGFAIGRLLGVVIDGKPNKLIVVGIASELILGSLNIFALVKLLM